MNWYRLCVVVHLMAMSFWLGHMFFWSLVVGPLTKRLKPPTTRQHIRELILRSGGLGWPALFILAFTGVMMLALRGFDWQEVFSRELDANPFGRVLSIKLVLVAVMILYQIFIGHRSAPRFALLNMIVALTVIGLSIILIRHPAIL